MAERTPQVDDLEASGQAPFGAFRRQVVADPARRRAQGLVVVHVAHRFAQAAFFAPGLVDAQRVVEDHRLGGAGRAASGAMLSG